MKRCALLLLALACERMSPEEQAQRDADHAREVAEAASMRESLCTPERTRSWESSSARLFTRIEATAGGLEAEAFVIPRDWSNTPPDDKLAISYWISLCVTE